MLGVEHPDGTTSDVTATLRTDRGDRRPRRARSGSSARPAVDPRPDDSATTPLEAVQIGAQRTVDALGLIVGGLGQLVDSIVNHPTAAPPVRARSASRPRSATSSGSSGRSFTLYVAGILSANLAVVNILPFPPLDGGRMLIITLKRVFGARISVRAEQLTYMVGFVFLFAFLIWVTGFDIVRGLGGS